MTFRLKATRGIVRCLAADAAGASAVEDGIMLGIFGSVIFFVFRVPFLELCRALGRFLGLT
jgi:hypothetical protein